MPPARMLRLVPPKGNEPRPSDEEIVAQVGSGNARYAAYLYDRIYDPIDAALCRVLGRREADHEDIMQRCFELVFGTLVRGRFACACSLPTWASAIAGRVALAALRARRRERRVVDHGAVVGEAVEPAAAQDVEREAIARADLDRVRKVLSEMSPGHAEALVLHDVLGHDLSEISTLTGTTVAAAQSRLVRGRKQFRERLRAAGGGEP